MLQATIYAHRSAIDGCSRRDPACRIPLAPREPVLARLANLGRTLLTGRSSEGLSDHLLVDIGLSRADLDAMIL